MTINSPRYYSEIFNTRNTKGTIIRTCPRPEQRDAAGRTCLREGAHSCKGNRGLPHKKGCVSEIAGKYPCTTPVTTGSFLHHNSTGREEYTAVPENCSRITSG